MNIVYVIEDYSENGGVEKIVSMKANTFYLQKVICLSYRANTNEWIK